MISSGVLGREGTASRSGALSKTSKAESQVINLYCTGCSFRWICGVYHTSFSFQRTNMVVSGVFLISGVLPPDHQLSSVQHAHRRKSNLHHLSTQLAVYSSLEITVTKQSHHATPHLTNPPLPFLPALLPSSISNRYPSRTLKRHSPSTTPKLHISFPSPFLLGPHAPPPPPPLRRSDTRYRVPAP